MTKKLLGKEVNEAAIADLSGRAAKLAEAGIAPTLAIYRIGEKPDDLAYERGAMKRAEKVGVAVKQVVLPEDVSQEEAMAAMAALNEDPQVHGILLFRPLPKHLDEEALCNAMAPDKDVDGITEISQARIYAGRSDGFAPCTAEACMKILQHYGIDPSGKEVAVIGRSQVIGKPVAMLLIKANATVTVCHTRTRDLAKVCKDKDILIAAAGHPGTVTADCLAPGQTVIDVAINFDENGNMCGDVAAGAAEDVVDAITPVPGGVGAVTTTVLMEHVIRAAENR